MKIFVPANGDSIKLTKDWEFTLFFEHRNESLVKYFHPDANVSWGSGDQSTLATIPKGTVLKVARVYIRNGTAGNYNSLTFTTQLGKKKVRFWAKLPDVNTMEGTPIVAGAKKEAVDA